MIDIAMDGPMIDGTWYNTQTGDHFTVRDSFFQDGQLIIQATDGRMFDYNTIQNYVRSNTPIQRNQPTQQPETPIPNEVQDLIEDDSYLLEEDKNLVTTPQKLQTTTPTPQPTLSEDEIIINRILSRVEKPVVIYNTTWKKFPNKQLEMLIDMMGVEISEIAKYFTNKIDLEEIRESLQSQIERDIKNKFSTMNLEPQTEIVDEDVNLDKKDLTEFPEGYNQFKDKTTTSKKTKKANKSNTKKK